MATRAEIQEAVFASQLPWPARLVMLMLVASRELDKREGRPRFLASTSLVERWTGLARSTSAEYVVALERAGWIERTPREWLLFVGAPECQRRETIPDVVRAAVFDRDGHACRHCDAIDDLTLDHVRPWSQGGDDTVGNLQVLCRSCNSSKGARI